MGGMVEYPMGPMNISKLEYQNCKGSVDLYCQKNVIHWNHCHWVIPTLTDTQLRNALNQRQGKRITHTVARFTCVESFWEATKKVHPSLQNCEAHHCAIRHVATPGLNCVYSKWIYKPLQV